MGERDWAAEARERWPGCVVWGDSCTLSVVINGTIPITAELERVNEFWRWSANGCTADPVEIDGIWHDYAKNPIAAIEAAIRAEQDEARATMARLAVWGVDQPEAVPGAAGVVLL